MSRRIDPHATADERSTRPRAGGILEEREDEGRAATEWDYDGCITLAITTCKRLREFLGTVDGLQAGCLRISVLSRYHGRIVGAHPR